MIDLVITGGQTGADQAGWRAAKKAGIKCSGWMPRGFLTEDGPRPEFAEMYGAREHRSSDYPPRTRANVQDSTALIWFGTPYSRGGSLTLEVCMKEGIPHYVVINPGFPKDEIPGWIADQFIGEYPILMVAGNRESSAPGIGAWVESYLAEVFRMIAAEMAGGSDR